MNYAIGFLPIVGELNLEQPRLCGRGAPGFASFWTLTRGWHDTALFTATTPVLAAGRT